MKKAQLSLSFLFIIVFSLSFHGSAQPLVPQVPYTVRFADLTLQLGDGARRIIQQDINALVLTNRRYWETKMDRIVLYFPLIESILQDEGIPVDFKYLAVQESSLTPDAVSASTAVGYWQFKKETATDHGLRVDDEIDERKSITASTRGAARYLKRSNAIYNNWLSALYSYYLGTGGINKLIPAEWAYAKEVILNERTNRYMLRFLAHKIAIESVLPSYRTTNTFALIEYLNGGGKSVAQVADELKINEQEIRKYNRWLLGDIIPSDKEYIMVVPVTSEQVTQVRQKLQTTPQTPNLNPVNNDLGFPVLRKINYSAGRTDVVLYEINGLPGIQALKGDNTTTLARKARTRLSNFLRYNDLSEDDPLTEGQVYYLAKKMRKAIVPFHTVREGETVRSISHTYGLRLKKLLRYNRLDRAQQRLQAGRIMWLRKRRPSNRPIEIINTPPATFPTNQPIIVQNETKSNSTRATSPTNRPVADNSIPKNTADRKLYTPKLVESTPSSVTRSPSTTGNETMMANPPATTTIPVTERTTSVVTNSTSSPSTTSTNDSGTRRVIIIRPQRESSSSATPPTYSDRSTATAADASTTTSRSSSFRVASADSTIVQRTDTEVESVVSAPVSDTSRSSSTSLMNTTTLTRSSTESQPTEPSSPIRRVSESRRSITHRVEAGQTYYSISRLYGVTVNDLLAWNNLAEHNKLTVGQVLYIKASGDATQHQLVSTQSGSDEKGSHQTRSNGSFLDPEEVVYHTVQKGETLFRISRQHGVTVEQIQAWNQLSTTDVKEGQRIKIVK